MATVPPKMVSGMIRPLHSCTTTRIGALALPGLAQAVALSGQNIELIDQLGHRDVAEDGHADDGPDQTLHGYTAAHGRDDFFTEQGSYERRGMRSENASNRAALLA